MATRRAGAATRLRLGEVTERTSAAEPAERMGYEQAREELVEVVRKLEAGGTTLEESLALWERGEVLASICQQWLDGARARLAAAGAPPAAGSPSGSGGATASTDPQ